MTLQSDITSVLDDAWLNLEVDDTSLFRPLSVLKTEDPEEFYKRFVWLCSQPEYFSFTCKVLLNIDLLPFQGVILKELWNRKFPMLIAARGASKSFTLAIYGLLRALLMPGRKIIVVGAAFRQSKVIYEYMKNIYNNSPVLKSVCTTTSGWRDGTDMAQIKLNDSLISALPIGNGQKIRGQRANDIFADEFAAMHIEIFENVVQGFGTVASNTIDNVQQKAKERKAKELGISLETKADSVFDRSNQTVFSGTAYYDFNHFATYWKKWKKIIRSQGNKEKLVEIFGDIENIPESFDWRDYSVIRIPYDILPEGLMDEGIIARSKATINSGIFQMEFGACQHPSTPIVTSDGIKKIIDIEIGDLVLTHKGRFRPVTKKMFRDYSGDIFRIKTYGYYKDLLFTPEHPFWISNNDFKEISKIENNLSLSSVLKLNNKLHIDTIDICDNISERDDFIYPISSQAKISNKQRSEIIDKFNNDYTAKELSEIYNISLSSVYYIINNKRKPKNSIPRNISLDFDFGLIMGYYASEGCISSSGRCCDFSLDGHIDKRLQYFVEELSLAMFRSVGLEPKLYHKKDNTISVAINSRILADVLKYICPGNCYSKIMNHDILFSNESFLKGFIVGVWNDDGHISQNVATIQLTNQNLINQIKLCLSYFDINCSFLKPNRPQTSIIKGKQVNLNEVWKLNISDENFCKFMKTFYDKKIKQSKKKNHIRSSNGICYYDILEKEKLPYNGFVYNLEVEEDNSYSLPNCTVHNCFSTDSRGFFKRSLLESCTCSNQESIKVNNEEIYFEPMLRGRHDQKYIFGVDPASEVDNFSIVVIEVHPNYRKIVYVWTTNRDRHKIHVKANLTSELDFYSFCARKIRDLMRVFPCEHIALDAQGGGISVMEALHDSDKIYEDENPIWPILEDKPKDTDGEQGLHILEMCQFAKYDWLNEANHGMKKDFEDRILLFPAFNAVSLGIAAEEDAIQERIYDTLEDCVYEIDQLKNELSIIEIMATPSGRERWDTPEVVTGIAKKERLRKDRYSALLMANMAARSIARKPKRPNYQSHGGFASSGKTGDEMEYIGPSWFTNAMKNVY